MQQFRKRMALLAPIAVLALGAAACGGGSSDNGGGNAGGSEGPATSRAPKSAVPVQDGGQLTFAYAQACPGFNLNNANDALAICSLVLSPEVLPGVFDVYPDYSLHASKNLVIEEPTNEDTSGKQVVTYKLNPKATWSDGQPLDVKDFQYIARVCNGKNTKYQCASTTGYDQIESVKAGADSHEVVVTFKTPFADWKSLFGSLIPAHIFEPGGADAFNKMLEGKAPEWTGGPFKITNYQKDQSVTMERWDGYYGQKPHLDQLTFRFVTDESGEPQALQNGEVDLIYPQPQTDIIQQVKNIPNVTSEVNLGAVFEHFDLNAANTWLKDHAVRQAILQGLNRNQLLDATIRQFTNKAEVLNNRIFMPGQKGYQDNSGGMGVGDVQGAQQTLQQAGYTKSGAYFGKNGQPISLTISTTAGNQLRQNQETIFKQQMQKVGIKIDIKNYPADKFFGDIVPNEKYDIADFAWVGTPFPISSNVDIYKTGGGENWINYSNKQVDQWLKQAVAETDVDKAISIMNQVDKQLWQDIATIPLYQKPTYIAYRNKYVNIQDNPTSAGPVWNVWDWGVKSTSQ